MDKLKKLGVLTYSFDDYSYKEFLFIDDKTGSVYISSNDVEDPDFSGVTFCGIKTNERDYFEETIKPHRFVEAPTRKDNKEYLVYLYSEKLKQNIKCVLTEEEYEGKIYKTIGYKMELDIKGDK